MIQWVDGFGEGKAGDRRSPNNCYVGISCIKYHSLGLVSKHTDSSILCESARRCAFSVEWLSSDHTLHYPGFGPRC